jgi:hypothetical protein
MFWVNHGYLTTGLTVSFQGVLSFQQDLGFRVLTASTKDKLIDEPIQGVLQFVGVVRTADQVPVVLDLGLGTQFVPEELDQVRWRTVQGTGNLSQVDNGRLDTVTSTFRLGLDRRHLVTVERIRVITTNVYE